MKDIKLIPIFKCEGKEKEKKGEREGKGSRQMFSEEQELAHKHTHT